MTIRRSARCLQLTLGVLLCCATAPAQEEAHTRVGLRLLPGTGLTWPHQELAGFVPSLPLGIGLEVHYDETVSMVIDIINSWHRGGSTGDAGLQLSSFQILGRYRFRSERSWTPFLQAGVGGYQAEIRSQSNAGQHGGPGLSLGGGVDWPLGNRFHLQAELRSNWPYGSASASDGELWMGHTQALAWLEYRLP